MSHGKIIARHNNIRDAIFEVARSANLAPRKEEAALIRVTIILRAQYQTVFRMIRLLKGFWLAQSEPNIGTDLRPDQIRPDQTGPGLTNFSALGCAVRLKL